MNPLVTVVIPAYNSEKTIEESINSVVNQSYKNIEIIVVNDGSIDRTELILTEMSKNLTNLRVFTINNSGPSYARNFGIKKANGDYIAFLDSDDKWLKNKIETQMNIFNKDNSVDMLGCLITNIKSSIFKNKINKVTFNKLLFKNYFWTPCVMVRKIVLCENQFDINRKYSEDYYLWLKIASNKYNCFIVNEVLVELADKPIYGGSGLSGKLWEMEKGELKNYKDLMNEGQLSILMYIVVVIFSFIKYVRRFIICKLRNI